MLGPQGELVVKELGLDGNLDEVPGSPPGRGRVWAARQGQRVWAVEEGLYHAKKRFQRQQGAM